MENQGIGSIDKNLAVETKIKEPDIEFHDIRNAPFDVYGFYNYKTEPEFKRLPDEVGENVNPGVKRLYKNTSGGRVRFCTDSRYVAIRAVMPEVTLMAHMPLLSSAGFDIFVDTPDGMHSRYFSSFRPEVGMKDGYESEAKFTDRRLRYITINFPSYSNVKSLEIGLQKGAVLGEGAKYRNRLPVVYYGSSITQGACASRPGNMYQNIVARETGLNYLNLGFSGSCRAEKKIVDYMAGLEMCAFVCDYDHNAPNPAHLLNTHLDLYKAIRAAHPDIPYIMLSRPDFVKSFDDSILRRDVIIDTFRYARESGDKNVYYIDGEGIFRGHFEDCCTVDGTHPNDIGFLLMAQTICDTFERIMLDKNICE